MALLSANCPHCQILIGLQIHAIAQVRPTYVVMYLQCGSCGEPSCAIANTAYSAQELRGQLNNPAVTLNDLIIPNPTFFPEQIRSAAPEHSPSEVNRVFAQARDAHKRFAYDLAAMGYRRALELALKAREPELKGQLGPRIDQLAAKHILTEDMKEWAHDSRVLGNEANHEPPEPTKDNVDQLHLFVESLIEYLFTLPEKVRLRRAPAEPVGGQ